MDYMKAWASDLPGYRLTLADRPTPREQPDEVLVKVVACGVCRTDLHIIDGELPPRQAAVIPGHQVVGAVERVGSTVRHLRVGQLVGIAWLRGTCGTCAWCRTGRENLCPDSRYTGWDADGGFALCSTNATYAP